MTKRERYLKALRGGKIDRLVWAPNFDYWLAVNKAEETLPEKYKGLSRNDMVRAVGGTIWNRASGLKTVYDASVQTRRFTEGNAMVIEHRTPVGAVRSASAPTEGPHRAKALVEHFVKDLDSLKVMRYIAEATRYVADYAPTQKALAETGADGIVLNSMFCVPFIQFAKTDVGYNDAFYMWTDHKAEVDALIAVYRRNYLQGYAVLAEGPADVIATGDNMDGCMISPDIFKEYAIPFYQAAQAICAAKGKLFEGHWCGRTQTLLPLVPGCGLDVVEAIVTQPMADITLAAALDLLAGQVVLQGGIPSVLVCEVGGTRADFERYLREVILPLKGRPGFILGMSDNVPPDADFARIESIAGLVA